MVQRATRTSHRKRALAANDTPKAVLAEYGIDVPDNIDVNVVENSGNTVHITLPMPPDGHGEISMEKLSQAAGGSQQQNELGSVLQQD